MASWMAYASGHTGIFPGSEFDLRPMMVIRGAAAPDPVAVGDTLTIEWGDNSRAGGHVLSNNHSNGIFEINNVRWSVRRDREEVWIVGAKTP